MIKSSDSLIPKILNFINSKIPKDNITYYIELLLLPTTLPVASLGYVAERIVPSFFPQGIYKKTNFENGLEILFQLFALLTIISIFIAILSVIALLFILFFVNIKMFAIGITSFVLIFIGLVLFAFSCDIQNYIDKQREEIQWISES